MIVARGSLDLYQNQQWSSSNGLYCIFRNISTGMCIIIIKDQKFSGMNKTIFILSSSANPEVSACTVLYKFIAQSVSSTKGRASRDLTAGPDPGFRSSDSLTKLWTLIVKLPVDRKLWITNRDAEFVLWHNVTTFLLRIQSLVSVEQSTADFILPPG